MNSNVCTVGIVGAPMLQWCGIVVTLGDFIIFYDSKDFPLQQATRISKLKHFLSLVVNQIRSGIRSNLLS